MTLEAKLRIGASGYSYDDWVGPLYPKGTSRSEFLKVYASKFPVVEVNATYYRVPPRRTFETMVRNTPPGFRFTVKAHQDMTHRRHRDPDVYSSFLEAIAPLREAGKFDGVLLQFPFGFRNGSAERAHLAFLRQAFSGMRLWAEFRHASWCVKPAFEYLKELSLGFCSVDEPALAGLMPPVAIATTDAGYVRFHGRNAATWWQGGHERYDWDYTPQELTEWLDRLRQLAAETDRTYVFFNNCFLGRAVKSARLLRRLLGLDSDLELDFGGGPGEAQ